MLIDKTGGKHDNILPWSIGKLQNSFPVDQKQMFHFQRSFSFPTFQMVNVQFQWQIVILKIKIEIWENICNMKLAIKLILIHYYHGSPR